MNDYSPYTNDSMNQIYNLLFCDQPELYKPSANEGLVPPWSILFSTDPDVDQLQDLLDDKTMESRVRVLAANKLLALGQTTDAPELLGVVIEVALDDGLDVLAAFADGTARYINYSEKLIVWDAATAESTALIEALMSNGRDVIQKIGKWDKARLPFPTKGMIRLTFLVSDGLYFGQGPFDVLADDPMGGPIISSATELMAFLTQPQ